MTFMISVWNGNWLIIHGCWWGIIVIRNVLPDFVFFLSACRELVRRSFSACGELVWYGGREVHSDSGVRYSEMRTPGKHSRSPVWLNPEFEMCTMVWWPRSSFRLRVCIPGLRTPHSAILDCGLRTPEYNGREVHSDFACTYPDSALCNSGLRTSRVHSRTPYFGIPDSGLRVYIPGLRTLESRTPDFAYTSTDSGFRTPNMVSPDFGLQLL